MAVIMKTAYSGSSVGSEITSPVGRALAHLRQKSPHGAEDVSYPITLNFHPDVTVSGALVIDLIARHGSYRSQFETGTSSGGLTAYEGGDRWSWESRVFGGAYDNAHPSLRPKYGALNYRHDPAGGSRRFGSCHIRLASHVRSRTSFCYPDSYWEPHHYAVDDVRPLIVLAEENVLDLDPFLDNYIEAHVHGALSVPEDVEAVVLDPSFKGTRIGTAAASLGCAVEWHGGFRLSLNCLANCETFRGAAVADAITQIAECGVVTPVAIWRARSHLLDYQMAKWVWHCVARYGGNSLVAT